MKDINEKNILDGIKQSVEKEAPDVWEKVKASESCKYELQERPLKMKKQNIYKAGAAIAACLIIAVIGFSTKLISFSDNNAISSDAKGGQAGDMLAVVPGAPQAAPGKGLITGTPEIASLYTKDADLSEASKALNIEITAPSWLPEGFTQASAQLVSYNEDNSKPYMYVMKYGGPSKEELSINISKYMTEEEKLKSQPSPMPEPGISEGAGETSNNAALPPGGVKAVPPLPPDAQPQSIPGYNPSESASPPPNTVEPSSVQAGKDTPQDNIAGSSGVSGTGSAAAAVSVTITNITINDTGVQMYITSSSGSNAAVSAYWIYKNGSYNITASGISQDDMVKIVESMIR